MGVAFKLKLEDGSVVGPLDSDMLLSWYQQGLIDRETPVLATTSNRWRRVREVLDVGHAPRGRSPAERAARARVQAQRPRPAPARGGRVTAGGMLIAGAVGAAAAWLMPWAWRADLNPVPWRDLGLVLMLLGVTALHTAEWTRRFARSGVALAAFALFPVAGMAIAQGVTLEGLTVVASAWLAATALFFLLSPSPPRAQLAAWLCVALLGAAGVVRFGVHGTAHAHEGWLRVALGS